MKKAEAISILATSVRPREAKDRARYDEAVGMAIEALQQSESCEDAIGRQAAIDRINKQREHLQPDIYPQDMIGDAAYRICAEFIGRLPSAQPERTCVNCGRTANNGGRYADGRTRCPIEEHYALPKDGYCHLWEKRNVTDDDYPKRWEA